MRMIIKGADFSAVSIGKVVKDLSFEEPFPVRYDFFQNVDSEWNITNIPVGEGYVMSDNEVVVTDGEITRAITDYIEVIPGMKITTVNSWPNTATIPSVVCFNANKELIPDKYVAKATAGINFTIPDGVYYVRMLTTSSMKTQTTGKLVFSMPE